jgi:hypothetical protein
MPTLQSSLHHLATAFAVSVLDAIRGASLQELLGEAGGVTHRGPGRSKGAPTVERMDTPVRSARLGRLRRRTPEEIAKVLDQVLALLKKNKPGLRAEQIREELGVQAKEMPRVLKQGLATKKLKSKGQKRATTYTAAPAA